MKKSILNIVAPILAAFAISSCDDGGKRDLLNQAEEEVDRAEKRGQAVSILNNARQIQLAMTTYALDKDLSGASHHWPTEEANSSDELRALLVNGEYFSADDFDKLKQNLLIGKVSKDDPEDTIVAISDNIPDSPVDRKKQLSLDSFVLITKGGRGEIYPLRSYDAVMKTYRLPPLLEIK
jgi:hypothetical protein